MSKLKDAILSSAALMNSIAEIAEDGKFNVFTEVWKLVPHISSIGRMAANMEEIKEEIKKGLTDAQEQDIIQAVQAKLDFKNDKAEILAESIVKWVLVTVLTVDSIIDAAKADKK